jgi:hypothetical protein
MGLRATDKLQPPGFFTKLSFADHVVAYFFKIGKIPEQ